MFNDIAFTGIAQPFNIADAVEEVSVHRDFFHGVRNVERLSDTRKGDVVVLGSVQQKIIAAGPLAVYRKLYSRSSAL